MISLAFIWSLSEVALKQNSFLNLNRVASAKYHVQGD